MGFQKAFEDLGNMLHPAGYARSRPVPALIEGLRSARSTTSAAQLRSLDAVREYLDYFFDGVAQDPSDTRYQYGYEDAHWLVWSHMYPRGHAAALKHLPR